MAIFGNFTYTKISVIEARAALEHASIVIAQINENMPRTFGDGYIHYSDLDYVIEVITLRVLLSNNYINTKL